VVRVISTSCLGAYSSNFFQGDQSDGIDYSELQREERAIELPKYVKPKKNLVTKSQPVTFGKKIG